MIILTLLARLGEPSCLTFGSTPSFLPRGLARVGERIAQDLFEQSREQFDLSGAEISLLFALRRLGPPYTARPRTLGPMLLITSGAVTKQINRLESRGLVSRSPDPATRNGQMVSLTDPGFELSERAVRHLARHSIFAAVADQLPESLIAEGNRLVSTILAIFAQRRDALQAPVTSRPPAASPLSFID